MNDSRKKVNISPREVHAKRRKQIKNAQPKNAPSRRDNEVASIGILFQKKKSSHVTLGSREPSQSNVKNKRFLFGPKCLWYMIYIEHRTRSNKESHTPIQPTFFKVFLGFAKTRRPQKKLSKPFSQVKILLQRPIGPNVSKT